VHDLAKSAWFSFFCSTGTPSYYYLLGPKIYELVTFVCYILPCVIKKIIKIWKSLRYT
jgi:hypothetical protein